MNEHRWILAALVCCFALHPSLSAADKPAPTRLDPETRKELERALDASPQLDDEFRKETLQRIEDAPKLLVAIESVTVYSDGIAFRASVTSDLPYDCRIMHQGRAFGVGTLFDGKGNEWSMPGLRNHYQFSRRSEKNTFLIEQGKHTRILRVDGLESPRLIRIRKSKDAGDDKPMELNYKIANWTSAYGTDIKNYDSAYLLGRGKTPVEWKKTPIPDGMLSRVIDAAVAEKG